MDEMPGVVARIGETRNKFEILVENQSVVLLIFCREYSPKLIL
jgi:hypothetical protein